MKWLFKSNLQQPQQDRPCNVVNQSSSQAPTLIPQVKRMTKVQLLMPLNQKRYMIALRSSSTCSARMEWKKQATMSSTLWACTPWGQLLNSLFPPWGTQKMRDCPCSWSASPLYWVRCFTLITKQWSHPLQSQTMTEQATSQTRPIFQQTSLNLESILLSATEAGRSIKRRGETIMSTHTSG